MLTPKQKAYLKSLAHPLKPCFQIGKEGLSENLRCDLVNYLKKHELMKVSILNNSSVTVTEIEEYLSDVDIEVVQKIGHTVVLYMQSDDAKNPIRLPIRK